MADLEITLKRSVIGSSDKHKKMIKSLGFTKVNQTKTFPDNEAIRGVVRHCTHLLEVNQAK